MTIDEVLARAYAMPLTNPAFPPGPYRFWNREFFVVAYRTDLDALRAVVPAPLEIADPIVKYEFIKMPDSTGFGDSTETGQVIPVRFQGQEGAYVHWMYLDDEAPIAGGRELWGFPKKFATPRVTHESDFIVGTLHYGPVLCVTMTLGYKHKIIPTGPIAAALAQPNFLLKIIPHVDASPRICELVRYHMTDFVVKGAWSSPAALELHPHALADVARLPVREVVSCVHYVADLTLALGEGVFADHAGGSMTCIARAT